MRGLVNVSIAVANYLAIPNLAICYCLKKDDLSANMLVTASQYNVPWHISFTF